MPPTVTDDAGHAALFKRLTLGESEAGHLGVDIERVKLQVIVVTALAIGAAVSVVGIIGFVGLIVPHLLRISVGADHRFLMPGCVLLGSSLLLCADLIARCCACRTANWYCDGFT